MIEKILLFLLIILLALLVANIVIKSICITTYRVGNNILKYGGMSPIDMSYKDEIPIPIFLNPIDKKSVKPSIFALSDLYDDALINKLSNKPVNIDGGNGSDNEDDEAIHKSKKSRPTLSRPNLLPFEKGSKSYKIISTQLQKIINLTDITIEENLTRFNRIETYVYDISELITDTSFLDFGIYPNNSNNIILNFLKKTNTLSGLQLLNWVTDLAVILQCGQISLEDASNIEYTFILDENTSFNIFFPLYCFYILQNGQSWYNTFGYYGTNYQYEVENNSTWISKSYQQFLIDLLSNFTIEFQNMSEFILTINTDLPSVMTFNNRKEEYMASLTKSLLSYFRLKSKINTLSQDVFKIDIALLTAYTGNLQDLITEVFNALLFIVQQYNPEINENTTIHEIFKYINQIIKDNAQLGNDQFGNAQFGNDQLSDDQLEKNRKKYALLLIFLNIFMTIISNLINYFVIMRRENPAITWSFLYYDCFDNGGDQLVKIFISKI